MCELLTSPSPSLILQVQIVKLMRSPYYTFNLHSQDGDNVSPDNESPELRRRLRNLEIALREQVDDLPPGLRDIPSLLHEVRDELEGHTAPVQTLQAQLDASQRELIEARTLLHTLIDSLPVGVTVADANGRIIMTNEAGVEILGGRPEGTVQNLKHPYTVHRLSGVRVGTERMPLFKVLNTGETFTGEEYRVRRPDGTERVVLTAAKPVKNADGEITSALTVFQDITEKKENEEAVRRYADRLHILRQMDRAILTAQSLVHIARLTLPHLHKLLPCVRASIILLDREAGTFKEKVTQVGDETRVRPGDPIDLTVPWRAVIDHLEEGDPYFIENTHTTDRADPLSAMWRVREIRAHLYQPIRVHVDLIGVLCIGIAQPGALASEQYEFIRELADQLAVAIRQARMLEAIRRHANELEDRVAQRTAALRMSEARFRAIFEEAPAGIALLSDSGRIIQSNATLQSMLGLDAGSLSAVKFYDYLHCEDAGNLQKQRAALLSGSVQASKLECQLARADGESLWARITTTLVGEQLDQPDLTLVMVQDITEERDAQRALIQTEKDRKSVV